MEGASHRLILLFLAAVLLSGCEKWGSLTEAKEIYGKHKAELMELFATINPHKEFRYLSSLSDPDSKHFVEQYGPFNQDSKEAYKRSIKIMEIIGVQSVLISRFKSQAGYETEITKFLVFGRGFGGNTEGIWIVHYSGVEDILDFFYPNGVCENLDQRHWYACQSS